jgi:hypothetical protein
VDRPQWGELPREAFDKALIEDQRRAQEALGRELARETEHAIRLRSIAQRRQQAYEAEMAASMFPELVEPPVLPEIPVAGVAAAAVPERPEACPGDVPLFGGDL